MNYVGLTAAQAAQRILGCYNLSQLVDPKIFMAALVEILSSYPLPVIARAANPAKGLASHCQFPNLADFAKHLDEWNGEYLEQSRRERQRQLQALPPPPEDPAMKERVGKLMAGLVERLKATA